MDMCTVNRKGQQTDQKEGAGQKRIRHERNGCWVDASKPPKWRLRRRPLDGLKIPRLIVVSVVVQLHNAVGAILLLAGNEDQV